MAEEVGRSTSCRAWKVALGIFAIILRYEEPRDSSEGSGESVEQEKEKE